ncbi:MAG TPA: patatin-like phospholipase family protein [Pyrinomonadaceae bacterium]|nr:patatin-like phospholipase family protein [Pyrinomonadaceae bacterium]
MTGGSEHRQAVILSGGGANGGYEVGVLKALLSGQSPATEYQPLDPDIFTGTSVGAFNAAFLVSLWETHGPASIANLETTWLNRLAHESRRDTPSGGYRYLANPLEFFDPRNFFVNPVASITRFADDSLYLFWDFFNRFMYVVNPPDEEGLTERLLYTIAVDNFITRDPFDRLVREIVKFDAIRRNRKELKVAATNWETGQVEIFSNFDFTDKLGPRIIMASSALPGFFMPETVGAQAYVDGAVLLNTPLKPAIRARADCMHIIYLDPDVSSIPLHYLGNLLSTLYRTQVINWAATVNESIREAEGINDALKILNAAEQEQPVASINAKGVVQTLAKFGKKLERIADYRMLTIHRYHPRDELGGPLSLLNFRRSRIEYLIERGFHDAVGHDCVASKCVLPDGIVPKKTTVEIEGEAKTILTSESTPITKGKS